MPVSSADVLIKLSTKVGAAGNSTAGTPNGSLGKYISTTEITDATLNNLFDDVSGDENLANDVEYRCVFIHNAHASISFDNVRIYLVSEVAGGASAAIGVDTTAASAVGAAAAQALEIADENTAPAGVAFSSPVDLANAINLGNIAAGSCRAFWIRRTAANTAAVANDGVTLRINGQSV